MDLNETRAKYPKSWSRLVEWFIVKENLSETQCMLAGHVILNSVSRLFDKRDLYDFFDSENLRIGIEVYNEFGNQLFAYVLLKEEGDLVLRYWSRQNYEDRQICEYACFEKAFQILEEQL